MKRVFNRILVCLLLLCMTAAAEVAESVNPALEMALTMAQSAECMQNVAEMTAETDADGLLGAEEGYSAKISWMDAATGEICFLEYFETQDAASARLEDLGEERSFRHGMYVLRLGENVSSVDEQSCLNALKQAFGADYVANKNTEKFHHTDCFSVEQIKDKNRIDYVGTRDALVDEGYVPCKRCNP